MHTIPIAEVMKQLPIAEIEESLTHFLQPIMERLPDKRLGRVVPLSVQGIVGSESPVVLQMAQSVSRNEGETWAVAKRMYGLLWNERFSHEEMSAGYMLSRSRMSIRRIQTIWSSPSIQSILRGSSGFPVKSPFVGAYPCVRPEWAGTRHCLYPAKSRQLLENQY